MVVKCGIEGCNSTSAHTSMHRLPRKNTFQYFQWIAVIGNSAKINANTRVCSIHFERRFKVRTSDEIPTLYLPDVKKPVSTSIDMVPTSPNNVTILENEDEYLDCNDTNTISNGSVLYEFEDVSCKMQSLQSAEKEFKQPIIRKACGFQLKSYTNHVNHTLEDKLITPDLDTPSLNNENLSFTDEAVISIPVCRLCLTNEHVIDVALEAFSVYDYDNMEELNDVLGILKKYTYLEFTEHNSPVKICTSCHKMIQSMQLFANMCRKSGECLNYITTNKLSLMETDTIQESEMAKEQFNYVYNNLSERYSKVVDLKAMLKELPSVDSTHSSETALITDEIIQDTSLCELCGDQISSTKYEKHYTYCLIGKQAETSLLETALKRQTKVFACMYCTSFFGCANDLKAHMKKSAHIDPIFLCEICGVHVSSDAFYRHCRRIHAISNCGVCGEEFVTRHCLRIHNRKMHPLKRKTCNICYVVVTNMEKHILEQHDGMETQNFKCDICGHHSYNSVSFERHKELHVENEVSVFCNYCGQDFSKKSILDIHQSVAHGISIKFTCTACTKDFESLKELNTHKQSHMRITCERCGRNFPDTTRLNMHIELKHIQSHKCPTCNKVFPTNGSLRKHILTHSGIYSHKCTICNQNFISASSLMCHKTSVHKVGLWCRKCNKPFATKTLLLNHELQHAGVKRYACRLCDKRFYRNNSLKEHLRSHTREQPFSCEFCGIKFRYDGGYKRHKMRNCKMLRNLNLI